MMEATLLWPAFRVNELRVEIEYQCDSSFPDVDILKPRIEGSVVGPKQTTMKSASPVSVR